MVNVQDGIVADLSEYQGPIDFARLSKVPNLKGVIIRVQAGSTHADTRYKEYVAGCKQYGIPFGTYAYFKGLSVSDAIQEAKDAYSRMDKDSKEFAVDIESNPCKNPADLVPAGQAFIDYMKSQGLPKVGLYTGDYFFKPHGLDKIKADFHWIAAYGTDDGNPHTEPAAPEDLWQFTSKGKLDGIQGYVDESVATGEPLSYFTGVQIVTSKPGVTVPPSDGWNKEGGLWYFYKAGERQIGWVQDKSMWYYLDPETEAMKQGWLLYRNSLYYLNTEQDKGDMFVGIQTINGVQHEFAASGLLIK